ncbi:hypothetical protein H6F47_03800 [Sphaerospermopsis sp. FACHB-1094]|nr:hypothetical protein [Sphaerospermopsis sp. FACHB-1094]MBD2131599.1 hypothetical protein [Sphaerospermopsis sp. FACHB-1094]
MIIGKNKLLPFAFFCHQSPITNHQSPITNHQSPITNHQSPISYLCLF